MRTSTCNCGATIHWAKTDRTKEDGSPVQIPLVRLTPEPAPRRLYVVDGTNALLVFGGHGQEHVYMSHVEDCPNAKAFSGRNKKLPPKETE